MAGKKITKAQRLLLLHQLSDLGYGQAESESEEKFSLRFYPVIEHLHAFDPAVVLVVGDRGTGKSELFNAVFKHDLMSTLAHHAPGIRFPSKDPSCVNWIEGYPLGQEFPDSRGLRDVLSTPQRAVNLWFAYLVRCLQDRFDEESKTHLVKLLEPPGGAPDQVLRAFDAAGNAPLLALDQLDRKLSQEDRWLFVGYDELDTLGGFDWEAMALAIRGLIGFWAGYARRWQRLRAKIFLRTDLFRRHAGLGGADLAKLAANRAELSWSDRNLFAVLLKRIANTSDELFQYCQGARIPFEKEQDPILGRMPRLVAAEETRRLIERMVGPYMGAGRKKGETFRWVLAHLRDGRGVATPRALVRLFEQAAGKEAANARVRSPKLLHPTALRQALEDVSTDHVTQATHEWPWIYGVEQRVKEQRLVPWSRREIENLLQQQWELSWGETQEIRPLEKSPSEFIDYLVELGVFRQRGKDRIDVPDIYLFGLDLRRKGGVKRK